MTADTTSEERRTDDDHGMMSERTFPAQRAFEREDEFARALAERDSSAWRQLFDEQYSRVYAYAYARTGSSHDAEDVASNVFVEAVRGIPGFRFRGAPVAAWLLRIAHNETVDLLNRRGRRMETTIEGTAATEMLPARDDIAAAGQWREISGALGALKREHREVITLRLIEGRNVAETAAILRKTQGAVKVLQMRALQSLRRKLSA
jgi:RNA polymerase sigma-70 factor (ECF subfamily)